MSAVHMIPGGNWIKHEQWNLEMLLLVIRNHMLATVKVFYTKKNVNSFARKGNHLKGMFNVYETLNTDVGVCGDFLTNVDTMTWPPYIV